MGGITPVTLEQFKSLLDAKRGDTLTKAKSLCAELIKAGIAPAIRNYKGGAYAHTQAEKR